MLPNITLEGRAPSIYVDANPLCEKLLTATSRYSARICLALAARGARVRFFTHDQELHPPRSLEWSQDQDLGCWAARLWQCGRLVPLDAVSDDAVGLWTRSRSRKRTFPVELSILHDLKPLIVPSGHDLQIQAQFQSFVAESLHSSDAALATSHSTKADAAWLSDFPQDRIFVVHSGPGQCVLRHLHDRPVPRRSNVGLVVSGLEPGENLQFVLDWFRSSDLMPDGTELWCVGRIGWIKSLRLSHEFRRGRSGRRIRFLGAVSDQQLCKLYQTVGWSIYPSLYEGFGFPVLDSLRHGVPVLTSCNSALREYAHPGVHFFDSHDAATLDQAWAECHAAGTKLVSKPHLDEIYNWDLAAQTILRMARGEQSSRRSQLHMREPLGSRI